MARQIKLDSRELIEIVDSDGNVTGHFRWNPADLDIVKRFEKTMSFFESMEVKENNLDEISAAIKEQVNFLLDSPDAAETLFSCNPLTPRLDGTYYFEYVFNALADFIKSELNVRVPKVTKRIKKYTDKYEK